MINIFGLPLESWLTGWGFGDRKNRKETEEKCPWRDGDWKSDR